VLIRLHAENGRLQALLREAERQLAQAGISPSAHQEPSGLRAWITGRLHRSRPAKPARRR
jgi:hypothetical protein